jgi:hypothetical protein
VDEESLLPRYLIFQWLHFVVCTYMYRTRANLLVGMPWHVCVCVYHRELMTLQIARSMMPIKE